MSFCSVVKSELCAVMPERMCCKKALLNSAFAFSNEVSKDQIKMNTENAFVARYINLLLKDTLNVSAKIDIKKRKKANGYTLLITDKEDIMKIAKELDLLNKDINQITARISGDLCVKECCLRAAVKGAFLASGSLTNPEKGYHFEISNHRHKPINDLREMLLNVELPSNIIKRGSEYVLYVKEKEVIADILNLMGSKEMFFKYHDVILMKDLKNRLNRKQNFEQANLDKIINASVSQILSIKKLVKSDLFDTLSYNLKEAATLRIENPEASLSELAEMAKDPVTRSGMNHRLKKLVEKADKI